jgi:hypothetical protein
MTTTSCYSHRRGCSSTGSAVLSIALLAGLLGLSACGGGPAIDADIAPSGADAAPGATFPGDFARLVEWLTGSFSSAAQAAADSAYHDIRLEMVRIWPDRADGAWFYVEQAVADARDRPYRQRVYQVRQRDLSRFESVVYTLPEPRRFVQVWRSPGKLDRAFARLDPTDLELRGGCAIVLMKQDATCFRGSTSGRECRSSLRGADYATSEVTLTADRLISWDRGFDADGRQRWGAEKGPYVFDRIAR